MLAAQSIWCRDAPEAILPLVAMRNAEPFSVGGFTVKGRRIVEMDWLVDRERRRRLDLTILDD